MAADLLTAIIPTAGAIIATSVTFFLGMRTIRIEQRKLERDREGMAGNASKLSAEILKLHAETERLRAELDEARQARKAFGETLVELEKQKAQTVLNVRNAIYPQLAELVYRLRNSLRELVKSNEEVLSDPEKVPEYWHPSEIGSELGLLTEDLYKYRPYLDEKTFDSLHTFKRLLQDASVLLNRASRPYNVPMPRLSENGVQTNTESEGGAGGVGVTDEQSGTDEQDPGEGSSMAFSRWRRQRRDTMVASVREIHPCLNEIYCEVDRLHGEIAAAVQRHFETFLERHGAPDPSLIAEHIRTSVTRDPRS